jgi:hypothetical protein
MISNSRFNSASIVNIPTQQSTISGWERVAMAIERIRERLQRTAAALDVAKVPYAVIGGNAVAEWVGRVDEGAVRFTKDVDILLRRSDLDAAISAMSAAGFQHHQVAGVDMFLDGPKAKPSEAVHVIFASERVKETDLSLTPDVEQSEHPGTFSVISLESLVRMKLTSFRLKDQTHIQDMIGVGLIDATWLEKLQPALAERLSVILETPE